MCYRILFNILCLYCHGLLTQLLSHTHTHIYIYIYILYAYTERDHHIDRNQRIRHHRDGHNII